MSLVKASKVIRGQKLTPINMASDSVSMNSLYTLHVSVLNCEEQNMFLRQQKVEAITGQAFKLSLTQFIKVSIMSFQTYSSTGMLLIHHNYINKSFSRKEISSSFKNSKISVAFKQISFWMKMPLIVKLYVRFYVLCCKDSILLAQCFHYLCLYFLE